MLLPSILHILDQRQIQPKIVEKTKPGFGTELTAAAEAIAGLEKIELEVANDVDLVKPVNSEPQPLDKPMAASSLEELLRIITKFEKSNQSRVVDVFE
jgi:hypothetical protein